MEEISCYKRKISEQPQQQKTKRRRSISQQTTMIQSTEPHSNDILSGRGGLVNKHPGNVTFRRVVEANKKGYHSCPKSHKLLLAQSIVEAIMKQNPPGRFLSEDKGTGEWFNVGKSKAIQKTSQALRENAEKIRQAIETKPKVDATSDSDDSGTENNQSDEMKKENITSVPTKSISPIDISNTSDLYSQNNNISNKQSAVEYDINNGCDKFHHSAEETDSDNSSSSSVSFDELDRESISSSLQCLAPSDMDNFDLFSNDEMFNSFDKSIDESLDSYLREEKIPSISSHILDAYPGIPTVSIDNEDTHISTQQRLNAYVGIPVDQQEEQEIQNESITTANFNNCSSSDSSLEPLDKDTVLSFCRGILEL